MKFKIFVPIFLSLVIISTLFLSAVRTSESIAEKVFRLHIIANSDSFEDQYLKLRVRDDILNKTDYLFKNVKSKKSAIKTAQENIDLIQSIAQESVINNGYNYEVNILVDNEYFNTRIYDNFTLPAGKYDCLKIVIGQGKGKNYWCVLFPSVCVNSCKGEIDDALNDSESKFVKDDYKVKFKAVEIYEKIKSKL